MRRWGMFAGGLLIGFFAGLLSLNWTIRDGILHLILEETGFARQILWAASLIIIAFLTYLVVRRSQSRYHVKQAEQGRRIAEHKLSLYKAWAEDQINRLNARNLPKAAEEVRGYEQQR